MGPKALALFAAAILLGGCKEKAPNGAFVAPTPPTATPSPAAAAQVTLPPPPLITERGHALILEFEGYDARPAWPGGASGVTIGIGYDLGYYSSSVIASDWREIRPPENGARLAGVSGKTGQRAHGLLGSLHDILIIRPLAVSVFDNVDVAREFTSARRAMPGFLDLRANCQAALLSLGFNRGWSMSGANRDEMRVIRDRGVPARDYELIAIQLRKMERVWKGTSIERGMIRRREAERELVLTP